ncbi:Glutathione S-transferase-like protein FUS3 [Penicillium chermesinum]|uniref:Glutathione S-transferase-like protein FUS3 n=1 Tax=Penicillium chermesinum TaxID=63820 RepID=A0A9W9PKN1_9EURO|nr:Glutathione S-transferase-like protein FUS3 [Penicillium chermesinum]KAJ5247706.1 Glutathione S-transferase-like protein FUS3 [Penicillium chermesinum]KAJ6151470.1 Glutathione S-transferase-like protein FUS3 [Penicillium chermesinum]
MAPLGTIYTYTPSPRLVKAQAAANLNGQELVIAPDFQFGKTNKTEEYLSKFPTGKVPAFEGADGTNLIESDAIAQYCAESGPAAGQLMGSTPSQRAQIRQWICFAQGEILDNVQTLALWRMKIYPYNEASEKSAMTKLTRALGVLETYLKGRTWLVDGEKISMADITVASSLIWGFSMIIDAEMRQKHPTLMAWYERVIEVDGVKEAFGPQNYIEKRQDTPE